MKRDPKDPAKLLMVQIPRRTAEGDKQGYLPTFAARQDDSDRAEWAGQEAVAFPDNWSIGSELPAQRVLARAQLFVDEFRTSCGGAIRTRTPACATPPIRIASSR